jgi:hypothetical protein
MSGGGNEATLAAAGEGVLTAAVEATEVADWLLEVAGCLTLSHGLF